MIQRKTPWPMLGPWLFATLLLSACAPPSNKDSDKHSHKDTGKAVARGRTLERSAEKGPVQLFVNLSPDKPRLSDLVQMEIRVVAPNEVDVEPPHFGQAVGDFLVRDYSQLPPSSSENIQRFRYTLEPVHTGKHLIRSIAIEFVDRRPQSENRNEKLSVETEPIEVEVTSELEDQIPDLAKLEPMLPPQGVESQITSLWLWLGIPVLLVTAIAAWMLRRKNPRPSIAVLDTPEDIASKALAALLAENLPGQGLFQLFYLRLTGIVRNYIESTTGVRAPEQTTEEFLSAMKSRNLFAAEQAIRLQDFLEAADMVKYAGQQPSLQQIDVSIVRAREFVSMNRSVPSVSQAL